MNIEKAKEEIQQLADKLKAELDAPEWPQKGDLYWTIDMSLTGIYQAEQRNRDLDRFRQSIGWAWRSSAEAQAHLDKLQATERVRQYIAKANGAWVADFGNERQQKATWEYNHRRGEFHRNPSRYTQKLEAWKYIEPELFDQLIEDCGDDILLIMGVE